MNSKLHLGLVLSGALLLVGCEHTLGEPANAAAFGEPNRITMMAQVVDPDPQYANPMTGSGANAAQAIDRYNKDAVKKPERISSTQVKGSGGGGN
jgi:hypothetical protein